MKKITIILLLIISTNAIVAQKNLFQTPFQKFSGNTFLKDSLLQSTTKVDKLLNLIVEFKEEPLFVFHSKSTGFKKSLAFYRQRFAEFSSDIGIASVSKRSLNKSSVGISHEYYKTFFGVRLTVASGKLSEITSLPYVKAVHYDHEVKATLEKSIPQIGADKIWETYGNQGEGIKVGIIDSGIDYMHPALGGGFGASFKVVDGYDFVNLDSDPVDDNGHGTHVAGIVSANSLELKGVAPKSILYAYKVLDENGHGLESDIISAIERTVDPNDDGDMSDKLDVVNMSLGSDGGNPNDASSIAVNNASKLGVVFVIAAGNSGYRTPVEGKENNYFYNGSASIGSPGTAELAITVGAVDSVDQRARFSSKGPNKTTFGIKPEVLAPGVNIHSIFLGQTTEILNGTSMATPMVTGVVALLKSIHSDWNTERIKSAVINTAKDIGLNAYNQGGGRVQAFKAVSSSSWITPAVLNLGLDEPSTSLWIRMDTFYVHNSTNASQNYTTTVSGLTGGITMSISPSGFTIPSGGSTQLIATTTVNNTAVPIVADDIPLYSGRLLVNGTTDTLSVPWAFARATRLTISFNDVDPIFFGTNSEHAVYWWNRDNSWISPTSVEIYGYTKGTYDFYTFFRSTTKSKIVIKENVELNNDAQTVNISSSEATIPLVFQSKDHLGNFLSTYPALRKVVVTTIPNWGEQAVTAEQISDTIMISPASERFVFRPIEYHFSPVATKDFHIAQYSTFSGFSAPKVLTNNSSDYISQNFKFFYPFGTQQGIIIGQFYGYGEAGGQGYEYGIGYDFDTVSVVDGQFTFKGYFQRSLEPLRDVAVGFYSVNDIHSGVIDLSTFPVMAYQDSIMPLTKDYADLITIPRSPDGGTTTFGDAPIHLVTIWYNNSFGTSTLHFRTIFQGANRETRETDVNDGTYSLYDVDGNLLFSNPLNSPRSFQELSPQWYKMVITSGNFWLRNKKGTIRQTSTFNLGNTQADPPSLTSFAVLNSTGQPVSSFQHDSNGSLVFSAEVIDPGKQVNPDSVKTWYRLHGTTLWQPLPVVVLDFAFERGGIVFRSDLSAALTTDSVAVELKVFMKDSAGNTNEFQIEPAFVVGNWMSNNPNDVEENPDLTIPKDFILYQNYPNPFNPSTTIRFGLPKQSSVRIEIYNLLGQRVEILHGGTLSAGFHNVSWNARVPSGVYFYRVVTASTEGGAKSVSQTKKMLLLR
jgi:subtilisin family serine protease